jgi:hypothetical protein
MQCMPKIAICALAAERLSRSVHGCGHPILFYYPRALTYLRRRHSTEIQVAAFRAVDPQTIAMWFEAP